MRGNQLCGLGRYGRGTYTTEGITKLCKGLEGSAITSLGCAAAPSRPLSCQAPLATTPPSPLARSLGYNQLCGIDSDGGDIGFNRGTYTTEGVTKLCEGLMGSAVTSLECAAAP